MPLRESFLVNIDAIFHPIERDGIDKLRSKLASWTNQLLLMKLLCVSLIFPHKILALNYVHSSRIPRFFPVSILLMYTRCSFAGNVHCVQKLAPEIRHTV